MEAVALGHAGVVQFVAGGGHHSRRGVPYGCMYLALRGSRASGSRSGCRLVHVPPGNVEGQLLAGPPARTNLCAAPVYAPRML